MAYQQMAFVYDKLMSDAPYDSWINFTMKVIQNSGKQVKEIADLGCGTGEITTKLAERGYVMTGVDYSSDMLAYAEHKASERNVSIQWLHQDLKELEGLANLDAAISYCDVMNYITAEDDIKQVFVRIADSLKAGGLFMFDVHSLQHVEQNYVNQTFADVTDDASYIWFCSEGDEPGEMFHELTFFSLDGDRYTRFDEYHHQRTYSVNFYKKLLEAAGFENINIYADFSLKEENINDQSERIFFIAEKRS
ncbi:class I SAM-dependent DNA methyltransferase [Oceanobacillus chungangensis]|uniref:SAM-dependent methyltransferase n=1 Tax=Oceanobacillus chungangensis TaxID=1229152 RepID=A0A3D8PZW9_9BACI|nr:class I SAM-dependent methyltransferase [Oceanobacillus chungangensis]RDW21740.1 SAM-dependent methyltransferase [Oceanobacillus chungangensis]